MALFSREPRKIKDFKASGIHFEELEMQQRTFKGNVLKCLWNALLIFVMLLGRVGFFVSAFNIPASMPVLIIGFVFISLYLAFLYLNSFTYNVGYIVLPILVVIVAAGMYQIANSGFSAIVNIIIKNVDKQFNLDNIREYNEFYANRRISTTVTLLLISLLLGIIINMCVSRRRSIFRPIIASLIIIEIGVYLNNDDFSYFYLFMLIFGCILYIYTRQNDNHEFSYKKKYRIYKVQKNAVDIRKNKVNRVAALVTAVFISVSGIILAVILSSGFSSVYLDQGGKAKEKSDVVVKNLAAYGLAYYFNNGNSGNGGIDNGKIGGTGTVILTGTECLTIDYVPYTDDEVYITNYVGSLYDPMNNRWVKEYPNIYPTIIDSLFLYGSVSTGYQNGYYSSYNLVDDTYALSSNILMDAYLKSHEKAAHYNMRIKNYGQQASFDPYYRYREVRDNVINTGSSSIINEVYPNNYEDDDLSTLIDEVGLPKTDTSLVDLAFYLTYTENAATGLSGDLKRVIKEEGFTYSSLKNKIDDDDIRDDLIDYIGKENNTQFVIVFDEETEKLVYEYKYHLDDVEDALDEMDRIKLAKEEFEIIEQLKDYYSSEFIYTLTPGEPQYGMDPNLWFLENKKGYCVYFASSAVLLLRELGVPARYAEGWAFDLGDLEDAIPVDTIYGEDEDDTRIVTNREVITDPQNIYDGYNELDLNSNDIVEVDLTDANAHAWVEVYIYGFGWIPVEFTLAPEDISEGGSSFLAGLFDSGSSLFDNDTLNNAGNALASQKTKKMVEKGFASVIIIGILMFMAFIVSIHVRRFIKLFLVSPERRAVNQYRELVSKIKLIMRRRANTDKEYVPKALALNSFPVSHKEFCDVMINSLSCNKDNVLEYIHNIVNYNYSFNEEYKTADASKTLTTQFKTLRHELNGKLPWYKRF